jgi:hypothetical protein
MWYRVLRGDSTSEEQIRRWIIRFSVYRVEGHSSVLSVRRTEVVLEVRYRVEKVEIRLWHWNLVDEFEYILQVSVRGKRHSRCY